LLPDKRSSDWLIALFHEALRLVTEELKLFISQ